MNHPQIDMSLTGIGAVLSRRSLELRNEIRAKLDEVQNEAIRFESPNAIDGGDAAVIAASEVLHIAEAGRHAAELQEIDRALSRALSRIESGTYGTCVDCGLKIAIKRLRITPSASRCASCQKASEAK